MAQCKVKKPRGKRCTGQGEIIYSANGFKDVDLCWDHWDEACAEGVDTLAWLEKNTSEKRSKK
jgi:hypothetical protein